jgi:hypothetical protein
MKKPFTRQRTTLFSPVKLPHIVPRFGKSVATEQHCLSDSRLFALIRAQSRSIAATKALKMNGHARSSITINYPPSTIYTGREWLCLDHQINNPLINQSNPRSVGFFLLCQGTNAGIVTVDRLDSAELSEVSLMAGFKSALV